MPFLQPQSPKSLNDTNVTYVMIVDDSETTREITSSALRGGVHVLMADSGRAALKILETKTPALILLDVMMPDIDGYDLARKLKNDSATKDIPIIFLTSLTDHISHIRGLSLGAADFLNKPIDIGILKLRVANILEREKLRENLIKSKSELQKSNFRLIESNKLLEAVFNTSSEARLVLNFKQEVIKADTNASSMLSVANKDLVGTNLREIVFLDQSGKKIDTEDLLSRKNIFECNVVSSQGVDIPLAIKVMSISLESQQQMTLLTMQDISNRKKLESQKLDADLRANILLAELKQQKYALDKHALVSIANFDGEITYVNERFCQVSGYTKEELLGKTHSLLKSSKHPDSFFKDLHETINNGETWTGEISNKTKNGEIYWVSSTIVPWLDKNGVPYQFVAILTDITDRIKMESKLEQSRIDQLKISAEIQNQLLISKPPQNLSGMSLACFSEGSQVIDGDFYIFQRFDDNKFDILTGDVMGKGITAALIAAGVQNAYKKALVELMALNLGKTGLLLPKLADIVNAMHAQLTPELLLLDSFVTLTLMRVDREKLTITWVNAGHTPILLSSDKYDHIQNLMGINLPIGVIENEVYEEQVTPIQQGDTLLLFSDGLSESCNDLGEQFGTDGIAAIVNKGQKINANPSVILNSLLNEIQDFSNNSTSKDDRTAVVLKIEELKSSHKNFEEITLELPRQLDQLDSLRYSLENLFSDKDEDFLNLFILASFEAATNILKYTPKKISRPPLTVLIRKEQLRAVIEMYYVGEIFKPKKDVLPDFSGDTYNGFGLFIIQNSVDHIEYECPMPGIALMRLIKNYH